MICLSFAIVLLLLRYEINSVNGFIASPSDVERDRNSIPPEIAKVVSTLVSLLPDDVEENLRKGGFNVYVEKSPEVLDIAAYNAANKATSGGSKLSHPESNSAEDSKPRITTSGSAERNPQIPSDSPEMLREPGLSKHPSRQRDRDMPQIDGLTALSKHPSRQRGRDMPQIDGLTAHKLFTSPSASLEPTSDEISLSPSHPDLPMAFNIGPLGPSSSSSPSDQRQRQNSKHKNFWRESEPLVKLQVPHRPASVPQKPQILHIIGRPHTRHPGPLNQKIKMNQLMSKLPSNAPKEPESSVELRVFTMKVHSHHNKHSDAIGGSILSFPPRSSQPHTVILIDDDLDDVDSSEAADHGAVLKSAISKLKHLPSPIPVLPSSGSRVFADKIDFRELPPVLLTPEGITAFGMPFDVVEGKLMKRETTAKAEKE